MSEYSRLMDRMYVLAEEKGKGVNDAWLIIEDVYWPNPHYVGEPVAHPESETVFHPPKEKESLKERFRKHKEKAE